MVCKKKSTWTDVLHSKLRVDSLEFQLCIQVFWLLSHPLFNVRLFCKTHLSQNLVPNQQNMTSLAKAEILKLFCKKTDKEKLFIFSQCRVFWTTTPPTSCRVFFNRICQCGIAIGEIVHQCRDQCAQFC